MDGEPEVDVHCPGPGIGTGTGSGSETKDTSGPEYPMEGCLLARGRGSGIRKYNQDDSFSRGVTERLYAYVLLKGPQRRLTRDPSTTIPVSLLDQEQTCPKTISPPPVYILDLWLDESGYPSTVTSVTTKTED